MSFSLAVSSSTAQKQFVSTNIEGIFSLLAVLTKIEIEKRLSACEVKPQVNSNFLIAFRIPLPECFGEVMQYFLSVLKAYPVCLPLRGTSIHAVFASAIAFICEEYSS